MSGAGIAHIFVAFLGDEPLAAIELFVFKNKLYYPYGGSSDMHKNVKAMNLIIWEAIRFGKDGGAETFDLWGSLPEGYDKNDPWAGFSDFKKGYGTRFVESTVSYDLVANLFLYKLYTWAFYLKKKLT